MAKQALLILGFVILFGILVPWYRGLDFLDPVMILGYACLALLFVAPAGAEAFAPDGAPLDSNETLRRSALVLAFGWGLAVLVLFTAIATVNLTHWHGYLLRPRARLIESALLMSLTASLTVVGACALLARRFAPSTVKGFVRLAYLILLAVLAFGYRFLPASVRTTLSEQMTSEGLAHFAFVASALFACAGAILISIATRLHRHTEAIEQAQEPQIRP